MIELAEHNYLKIDDNEASPQEDLYLSYHPDLKKFISDKPQNGE